MSDIYNRKTPMKVPLRIEDAGRTTVFQIRSVVVSWRDVGVDSSKPDHMAARRAKQHELLDWLDTKCRRYEIRRDGVWFLDPEDAMRFKLTWAGMITG